MKADPSESAPSSLPKTRMFIMLGVMLFVGFLLTSAVSYLVSRNSIRKSILQNELPLSSNNIYSEIQRDLFEPILISSLMANDTFVKDWILHGEGNVDAIIKYLAHIQEKYRTITSFLVSENTRKYYHSDRILKTVQESNPADAWFFRVRQMKQSYEINVDPDMANRDAMTIFINYRILDSEGKFLGATGVGLTVNAVKKLMQNYRTRYHRDVYFYDRQGRMVLNSFSDGNVPNSDHHSDQFMQTMLAEIAAGKTDINLSGVGENNAMANYRYIPELDWILVVEQTSDGTQPILFQSLGLNLLICLLVSVVLLSIIRKAVLRYQQNLESRNRQLSEKNTHIEQQSRQLTDANQKLDAMHREKDEFIGITVHDLKNPLSSVLGFSDLLLREPSLTDEQRDYINQIFLSSRSMFEQVEDLLKLTELEGPTSLSLTQVNAGEAVRKAIRDFEFQARIKGLSLIQEIPAEPLDAKANEAWLVSAVSNLLSNAIKYSPTGSTITVTVRREKTEVCISVKDQGKGISEQEQERLFRKFERLSVRPTGGESSSGLGLYLVHQMLSRMGGRVWCESREGSGSVFTIALPVA